MKSAITGPRAFDLGVPDVAAACDFYRDVWRLSIAQEGGASIYLRGTGSDHHLLGLHPADEARLLRYDLRARDRSAVDELWRLVSERGLETEAPGTVLEPGGGYAFSFLDPEGRTTRIIAAPEVEALPSSIECPVRISHMLFNTGAKAEMVALYTEALGFRVIDHMFASTFLNCAADHHGIGFSASGPGSALHHVAFEMVTFDAVMRGAGRMRHAGYNLDWGVGRHGPGDNVYAYFVGPHREIIEYTTEMAQVGPDYEPRDSAYWEQLHPPGWTDHWGMGDPSHEFRDVRGAIPFHSTSIFHPPP